MNNDNDEHFMNGLNGGYFKVLRIQEILYIYRNIIWANAFSGNRVDDMRCAIRKIESAFGRPCDIFSRG
jgi:hypothetical protein